jgi:hypothetical protein
MKKKERGQFEDYGKPRMIWLLRHKESDNLVNLFFNKREDAKDYVGSMEGVKIEKWELSKSK